MTRHKIVIATIAVSAMLLYALPAQNLASASDVEFDNEAEVEADFGNQRLAQRLVDETTQRIDQDARQNQEQDQEVEAENEATQSNEATISQDETNSQANVIDTGDNTATTTQIGDNDVVGSALESEGEGGSAESYKPKKSYTEGGDGSATSSIEQEVDNEAATAQDSSADNNFQQNNNEFATDIALVDQDNVAEQTATAVGVQTAEQDLNQYATNVDLTAQLGENAQEASAEANLDISLVCEFNEEGGGGPIDACLGEN